MSIEHIHTPDRAILREAAQRGLAEDRGPADITTLAAVDPERIGKATVITRESFVMCGLPVAEAVFFEVNPSLRMKGIVAEGAVIPAQTTILRVEGPLGAILTAERTALNFLQQLSAVATKTRQFVDAVAGTKAKILDTRKTVPGLRALQKYAVRCGGGTNHRFGLYDQFLFKDNHLALMGEKTTWPHILERARNLDPDALIEIEADTLEQVQVLKDLPIHRILLDNMTLEQMRTAVEMVAGKVPLEASGTMSLDRVRAVAETGVDYISVGALTHTVKAIDLSLEIVPA